MNSKNIIVIGASAGGFEPLKELAANFPRDMPAAIFVVWHMAPEVRGVLPNVLGKVSELLAAHAFDGEEIVDGRIYIAPPDRHLLIENDRVRVTRGPKENRFRPAIDPLFRSAAFHYGPDVIGVVLSGALDDGTSGLWTIKQRGGVAIVQDPREAEVPSMPESALREVSIDYKVAISEMPHLLSSIIREKEKNARASAGVTRDEKAELLLQTEIGIAAEDVSTEIGVMDFGELTPYTCPECHGVLSTLREGNTSRFRCHTGHAFTWDSLLSTVTEDIENSLWSAIRGVDESIILLNHMGDHFADVNQPKLAALFFRKAKEAQQRNEQIRDVVFAHEQFSSDSLREQSEIESGSNGEDRPQIETQSRVGVG